jgi:2-iminobutanoate/2-iminopropanoate deaminase
MDPASGELADDTIEGQTRRALENLAAIVTQAGGGLDAIVKTTVYLKDIADFASMNRIYSDFFVAPYPARVCFGGCDLPGGALVEIEAVAAAER